MTTYDGITTSDQWLCESCGRPRSAHECGGFQRRHHEFVGMMRIKDESRWIGDVLRSIQPLCDHIFVLNDNSTDDTGKICRSFEKVTVFDSPFSGLNESRDKNWLYDQIMAHCEPNYILCVDGDEVLESNGPDIIRHTVAVGGRQSYSLQIAFIWNDPDHVRVDRIYGDFWRPSLFKPFVERPHVPDDRRLLGEFRFMATPFGRHVNSDQPNLHCSSVPQRLIHGRGLCPARLKHYGYMDRADRVRKLDYYTSIDWANAAEDSYRHVCQGDVVTAAELPKARALYDQGLISNEEISRLLCVPADMRLVHAGPISVVPWNENEPWPISDWARQQHA